MDTMWEPMGAGRLVAAQVAASFGLAAGGTSGALLAADMTGSDAAGALPVGLLAFGAAVTAPMLTWIMSRQGSRSGLMWGYAGAFAGAAVVLLAVVVESVALLLMGSVLLGAGTAAVMLTRYAVADLSPPEARGRALSRSLFATTTGAVIGPLLLRPAANLATPLNLPPEAGLYVVALAAFALGAQLLRTAPDPSAVESEQQPVGDRDDASARRRTSAQATTERLALVILATANAVMVAVMATGVVHLRSHGYSLATIGTMVSVHVAAMFVLSPVVGRVCDRIGPIPLATAGAGLLAAVGVLGTVAGGVGLMHMAGVMLALGVGWSIQMVAGSTLITFAAPVRDLRAAEGRAELTMGLAAGLGTVVAASPIAAFGGFRLMSATVAVVSSASVIRLLWFRAAVNGRDATISARDVDDVFDGGAVVPHAVAMTTAHQHRAASSEWSALRVAVIVSSTRDGRFGPTVASWFVQQLRQRTDMSADVIDLAHEQLPAVRPAESDGIIKSFGARLDRADAFVVVTPEYNHGYPASLKLAIDYAYQEWHAKPVAFVAYGGVAGGLRAVEQLRQVFAELHAVTIRDTVSFHLAHTQFNEHGQPIDADRPARAAEVMLDELAWWAHALRDARAARAYAA